MNTQTLIRMANQIARNFGAYPAEQAASMVQTHLASFWERRMLNSLFSYLEADGRGVEPAVIKAASALSSSAH